MSSQLDQWDPSWAEPTPSGRRRVLRTVAIDVTVIVAISIVVEVGLHAMGYAPTHKTVVGENEFGYREKEFSPRKPRGQIRILALGDSTTFGTGLSWTKAYPKQLEALLDLTYLDKEFLVVNAGGEASCLQDAWKNLERNCELVDPDMVLFLLAPSTIARQTLKSAGPGDPVRGDINAVESRRLRAKVMPVQIHSWLHGQLKAYQFVQHEIRFRFYRLGLIREDLTKRKGAIYAYAFDVNPGSQARFREIVTSYERTEEFLVKVRDHLEDKGIPLYVPAIPSRFMISDLFIDNFRRVDKQKMRIDPYSRFQKMCEDNSIPFIDVKTRLVADREAMARDESSWNDLYIPDDYTHLNRTGNQILAQAIIESLDDAMTVLAWPETERAVRP